MVSTRERVVKLGDTLMAMYETAQYRILSSLHQAVDGGRKVPYTTRLGNWRYSIDENLILHIVYHSTEVITASFSDRTITNVTTGDWDTISTKAGITKHLRALGQLGYFLPGFVVEQIGEIYSGRGAEYWFEAYGPPEPTIEI